MYYYEKYGANGICVGTDFNGTDFLPDGLENYGKFSDLKTMLVNKGVAKEDADKILFKNLKNFIATQ